MPRALDSRYGISLECLGLDLHALTLPGDRESPVDLRIAMDNFVNFPFPLESLPVDESNKACSQILGKGIISAHLQLNTRSIHSPNSESGVFRKNIIVCWHSFSSLLRCTTFSMLMNSRIHFLLSSSLAFYNYKTISIAYLNKAEKGG